MGYQPPAPAPQEPFPWKLGLLRVSAFAGVVILGTLIGGIMLLGTMVWTRWLFEALGWA